MLSFHRNGSSLSSIIRKSLAAAAAKTTSSAKVKFQNKKMSTSNRKENIQSPPLKVSRLSSLQPRLLDDCLPPAAPPHPKSEDVDGGGGNNSKPAPSLINLLRGWPNPSLLAVEQLKRATDTVLEDKKVWIPGLEYAPDPGFVPLRGRIAEWTVRIIFFISSSLHVFIDVSLFILFLLLGSRGRKKKKGGGGVCFLFFLDARLGWSLLSRIGYERGQKTCEREEQ